MSEHVRTRPKAYSWRKAFGEERAAEIVRTRLVPFGIALWDVVLLVLAAARLLQAMQPVQQ